MSYDLALVLHVFSHNFWIKMFVVSFDVVHEPPYFVVRFLVWFFALWAEDWFIFVDGGHLKEGRKKNI